jgi:hypothetical protein
MWIYICFNHISQPYFLHINVLIVCNINLYIIIILPSIMTGAFELTKYLLLSKFGLIGLCFCKTVCLITSFLEILLKLGFT